ncbi:efflux RND transporter periplasmic adaptor subunit [Thalassotalea montiporae]
MHIKSWLTALLIIVTTIGGLGFFKFQQIQAAMAMAEAFPEPSAAVKTHITQSREYVPSYQVNGQIVAKQIVQLQNELPGIIYQVNFAGGDKVNQGDLLLSLNTSEEQAQLASAKATLKLRKSNFARMATLVKQNKVSQQEFDLAEAEMDIAKSNIENLQSIIAKKQIVAPFTGVVGLDTYQVGQFLPSNSTITTIVGDDANIWVDFQVPQTKRRLNLNETVVVTAIGQNGEAQRFAAKIVGQNAQMQASSRHMIYRAEINDGATHFRHNELVKITINAKAQQLVVVPNSAVVRNQLESFVYQLVQDDNKAYRAQKLVVSLGERLGDEQVILAGLEVGTLIATEGSFKLRPGLLVYPEMTDDNSLSAALIKMPRNKVELN